MIPEYGFLPEKLFLIVIDECELLIVMIDAIKIAMDLKNG